MNTDAFEVRTRIRGGYCLLPSSKRNVLRPIIEKLLAGIARFAE